MNPSLKMYKALKIQQAILLTILCGTANWSVMKWSYKKDSLLIGFRHLFTTEYVNSATCGAGIHYEVPAAFQSYSFAWFE